MRREKRDGMRKGMAKLAAGVTLIAALALVLSVTGWAEEQQPAGENQVKQQAGQGLTVDYWEPQVGEKTVYRSEDPINDIHGNIYGTSQLGYWDAAYLYTTSVSPINFASSHYYGVQAISHLNPVHFDLEGPWYFNMTTPYAVTREVVDISQAPEAAEFPEATFAIRYQWVFSGGHRVWGYIYCSNDAAEKAWKEWGFSREYYDVEKGKPVKEIDRYLSDHDRKTPVSQITMSFPISVGDTGSIDAVYVSGGKNPFTLPGMTWEAVAEGKVVTPAGTFDALLIRFEGNDEGGHHFVSYDWLVQGVGFVAEATSLPAEVDHVFGTATSLLVMKEFTAK